MSKRPSLEAIAGAVAPRSSAVGAPRPPSVNVVPGPGAKPAALRKDKPHVSLYLDKRVQRVIKEIALAYDRKPHDLYIEAINMMLRSYGKGTVADIAPHVVTWERTTLLARALDAFEARN